MPLRDLLPSFLRAGAADDRVRSPQGDEPTKLTMTAAVELTAAADDGGDGAPKRATFASTVYTGGPMQVGGFPYPVVVDLTGLRASKNVKVLRDHDPARIVGHSTAVEITAQRVKVSGVISGTGPDAQEVVANAKNEFPWELSMGAPIEKLEYVERGAKASVNGRSVEGPAYVIRGAILKEVSFVALGGDANTSARIAAAHSTEHETMKFNEWLKAQGITDFDKLSEPVQKQLRAAFDATQKTASNGEPGNTADPATPPAMNASAGGTGPTNPMTGANGGGVDVQKVVADAVKAAMTEANQSFLKAQQKREQIISLTDKHPTIRASALNEDWSIEKVELEVLKASRPQVGALYINSGAGQPDIAPERVLEAAICQHGNLSNLDKQFDTKTLEAADKQYRGRISLQQLMLEAAWAGGYNGRHFDQSGPGLKAMLQASFSTLDLSGILSNVANKFLLAGFMAVEDTWRMIAAVRAVNDFKRVTSYRLTGDLEFEEVGKDGELKHKKLGEESFGNQARTYGIMAGITRTDLKNDDLGAITATPRMIGRGGALKLNSKFWTAWLDNSGNFFHADNNNYFEGASSALSIDSLTTAETKFFDQTDADGKPLAVNPAKLLVPNALATLATSLTRDLEIRDTTASKKYTTSNPHAGKWQPVRSSYLNNAAIAGGSATAFFLLADPEDLAAIEVCFVDNVQQPFVETAEADFNTLGIQMRGYFDFGVEKQDSRAAVKSKGAA